MDWRCGDHAGGVETELQLRAKNGNICAKRREYDCTENTQRERLVNEEGF
jgi:hypothetical protein